MAEAEGSYVCGGDINKAVSVCVAGVCLRVCCLWRARVYGSVVFGRRRPLPAPPADKNNNVKNIFLHRPQNHREQYTE